MAIQSISNALIPTITGNRDQIRYGYYVVLALLGSAVLAIAAKITVPMWPVPATLQTLALFTIAAAYGRNLAIATLLLYLAEGAAGLPVFATGAGLAYVAGPTGGYLVGFLIAAAIVGYAADRGFDRKPIPLFGFMLAGEVVILALGAAWLTVLLGVERAISFGIGPFIVTDLIKVAIASLIVPALWTLIRNRHSKG